MSSVILNVPVPERIPQETGFWCGPATCQTAAQVSGVTIEEQAAAAAMGTTEDGTSHIGLLADYLNMILSSHHADWQAVFIENDPMTQQQRDEFWDRLTSTVDAGFAFPMNWVAPPGAGPEAVLPDLGGQIAPNQPGYSGTIYHYVCGVGYAENDSGRYIYVGDSGFSPYQFAIRFDGPRSACALIPPKGYVWASASKRVGVPTLPGPVPQHSQAELLSYAMDEGLTLAEYEEILPYVLASLEASKCNTVERVAQWMAQIGHESGGLLYFEELADGSQYEGREDLGNTHPGDGPKYKGHGPIQITGFYNHEAVSQWAFAHGYVQSPTAFVDHPEALASWEYGFQGTNWYWTVARGDAILEASDRGDTRECTRLINGGYNGLEDREARYARALTVAASFLPAASATEGDDLLAALSPDEQREVLDLVRVLADTVFPSRSPLRHIGEGPVDTVAGMTLNTDASSHIQLVIRLAELGDLGAIDLLNEVARNTEPDRQSDAKLAQRILTALQVDHTNDATAYSPRPAAAPAPAPPPPTPPRVRPAARGNWRL